MPINPRCELCAGEGTLPVFASDHNERVRCPLCHADEPKRTYLVREEVIYQVTTFEDATHAEVLEAAQGWEIEETSADGEVLVDVDQARKRAIDLANKVDVSSLLGAVPLLSEIEPGVRVSVDGPQRDTGTIVKIGKAAIGGGGALDPDIEVRLDRGGTLHCQLHDVQLLQ